MQIQTGSDVTDWGSSSHFRHLSFQYIQIFNLKRDSKNNNKKVSNMETSMLIILNSSNAFLG